MTDDQPAPATGKWWARSLTVWGALVTAAVAVLPAIGAVLGLDIPADLAREAGDRALAVIQAIIALAGTLATLWGRARASAPLERRDVTIKV